jgi:hypothetical protein
LAQPIGSKVWQGDNLQAMSGQRVDSRLIGYHQWPAFSTHTLYKRCNETEEVDGIMVAAKEDNSPTLLQVRLQALEQSAGLTRN